MGLFFYKYSLTVEKSYDDTAQIFRDNLDDMSKKGYSMTKYVVNNSDHKGRCFSGEYKQDGFVVRQTDSGTDDFYYRLLPKHHISFKADNGKTQVNVKSSNPFLFALFMLFAAAAIFLFSLLMLFATMGEVKYTALLFALIPLVICAVIGIFSRHQLNDTKDTLRYIYSDKKIL